MKIVYNISFFVMLCFHLSAQQGLEGIIVEKYYISNENDKAVDGDGGELPNNSVTYRVYVDMLCRVLYPQTREIMCLYG